jgi:hypothetical protein
MLPTVPEENNADGYKRTFRKFMNGVYPSRNDKLAADNLQSSSPYTKRIVIRDHPLSVPFEPFSRCELPRSTDE